MKISTLLRPMALALAPLLLSAVPVFAQADSGSEANPYARETPAQHDARMKWWREARFGMFIHWGVYSVPAGTYDGKKVPDIGEWIMNHGKIPVARYTNYAKEFNPTKFDADRWVELAKAAGMKYIVITAKHHDGFAMFDSKASDWNIVKATPYARDPLVELAAACKRHGIRFGLYYSQAQDWVNPGGAIAGGSWDKAQEGSMDEYIRNICVPQMKEILSRYGEISVLWFDTPFDMNRERSEEVLGTLKLQPGIIFNDRLGGGFKGDTETPEQRIPATGYPGRDWETCMTMNDTWGYKSYDNHWKSAETLLRNLIDIASKGGNYLLNVGPTSEGLIPEASVERLQAVGKWMRANGVGIYDTTASPFKHLSWGRCTKQVTAKGATLYLHVFDWPQDGKLAVPGLHNHVTASFLLTGSGSKKLTTTAMPEGVVVSLPSQAPDPISSTVVLKVRGLLDIEPQLLSQGSDLSLTLPASEAELRGSDIQVESSNGHDNIGYWTNPGDWAEWQFKWLQPGKYVATAEVSSEGGASVDLSLGNQNLRGSVPDTGDYHKYQKVQFGVFTIEKPGRLKLALNAVSNDWHPVNVRSIQFTPNQ